MNHTSATFFLITSIISLLIIGGIILYSHDFDGVFVYVMALTIVSIALNAVVIDNHKKNKRNRSIEIAGLVFGIYSLPVLLLGGMAFYILLTSGKKIRIRNKYY